METVTAIKMAAEARLDLVEISPDAKPPVGKILDYGKFKFRAQKKAAEARKKQKVIEIKEIKLRPMIDDHDYDAKMRAINGSSRKATRSRSPCASVAAKWPTRNRHPLLDQVKNDFADVAKVEQDARFEGRQIVMVLAPR